MSATPAARRRRIVALAGAAGLAIWFLVFTRLHAALGRGVAEPATANALTLQSFERALHLDIELPVNRWLAGHPALIQPAVIWYRAYYAVVIGVLVWLFIRHTDAYRRARRALVAMTALALPVFWALPMSPPRFAVPGVVDVIATYDPVWGAATRDLDSGRNLFSAMPSLHVGLSMWCAYAAWSALRRRSHPGLALLPWLYPVTMAAVVLGTGNHYVLDIAGSAVLLGTAVAVAALCGRLTRRMRWRDAATSDRPTHETDGMASGFYRRRASGAPLRGTTEVNVAWPAYRGMHEIEPTPPRPPS